MTLPTITGEFRLGADPELRFTPSGMAVCSMRAVASSRKKDEASGEWRDDKSCWVTLTTFKQVAENCAESLEKGMLVSVVGKLEIQEWTDQSDNRRQTPNILIDSIGPSLSFATSKVSKVERQQQGGGQSGGPGTQGFQHGADPWSSPAQGGASNDEPPF